MLKPILYEDGISFDKRGSVSYNNNLIFTEDLFESFKLMYDQKKTPNDFGLAVKEHPDNVLQVTAKNKMRATAQKFINMDLTGKIKETAWISKNEETLKKNLETIKSLKLKMKHLEENIID